MSTKKNKKFNIIDAVLIVIITTLAVALILAALSTLGIGGTSVKIRYVLETENLSSEFTSKVAVGDGVFTFEDGERLGTVSAVSQSPARHTGTDREGMPVYSEIDGYGVLYITVEAVAEPKDIGYAVGSTVINTGRDMEVRLPSLYCGARCISIEEIEE